MEYSLVHLPWNKWDNSGIENEAKKERKLGYLATIDLSTFGIGILNVKDTRASKQFTVFVHKVNLLKRGIFGKRAGWWAKITAGDIESESNKVIGFLVAKTQASLWDSVYKVFTGDVKLLLNPEAFSIAFEELASTNPIEHTIINCPNLHCGKKLRIPKWQRLEVKCSVCNHKFDYTP